MTHLNPDAGRYSRIPVSSMLNSNSNTPEQQTGTSHYPIAGNVSGNNRSTLPKRPQIISPQNQTNFENKPKRQDRPLYENGEIDRVFKLRNEGKSWKDIKHEFPNRSTQGLQCSLYRHKCYIGPRKQKQELDINGNSLRFKQQRNPRKPYDSKDVNKIFSLKEKGNSWADIQKHFPDRPLNGLQTALYRHPNYVGPRKGA